MITAEYIRSRLAYQADTGLFYWVDPPKNHPRMKGYVAGGIASGYVLIKVDGRKHKAHRLAWLYSYGVWPDGDIDHKNGCPLDNRLSNLREATASENQANCRRYKGKILPKGVRQLPSGCYQARIRIDGVSVSLGTFDTEAEAENAYFHRLSITHGDFARAD